MKKLLTGLLALLFVFVTVSCAQQDSKEPAAEQKSMTATEQKAFLDALDVDAIDEKNECRNVLSRYDVYVAETTYHSYVDQTKDHAVIKFFMNEEQPAIAYGAVGHPLSSWIMAEGAMYQTLDGFSHITTFFPRETYEKNLLTMMFADDSDAQLREKMIIDDQVVLCREINGRPLSEDVDRELLTSRYNKETLYLEEEHIAGYAADGTILYEVSTTMEYGKDIYIPCEARDKTREADAEIVTVTVIDTKADGTESTRTFDVLKGSSLGAADFTGSYGAFLDAACTEAFVDLLPAEEDLTIYFKAK